MAIKMKAKSVAVPEPVKEEPKKIKKPMAEKMPEMPKIESKPAEPTKETKEKKKPPKTPKAAQKPVPQEEETEEKFAETIKTKKSTFHKAEFAKGNFIFLDEGNDNPSVFEIVHVKERVYAVDITSKGELAESIIEVTQEDIKTGKIDGFDFAVYSKDEEGGK